ncbi:MAG: hypothetical protein ABJL72_18700 [Roseobacter sp.]
MDTKSITIKNVKVETVQMLAVIRDAERRQLCVILEDAIEQYWRENFDDD